MKLKWLWTTWTYVTVVGVVVLDVWALAFTSIYIIPKMEKIHHDGMLTFSADERPTMEWMFSFLGHVQRAWGFVWIFWVLALLWGLFEWRVRGESKPFIRLSVLGTAALALTVVVVLTAGSLVLPTFVGFPSVNRTSVPTIFLTMARIHASVGSIDRDAEKEDWAAAAEDENLASDAMGRVVQSATRVLADFTPPEEKWEVDQYLERLKSAKECLAEAHEAIQTKDLKRLKAALQKFRELNGSLGKPPMN